MANRFHLTPDGPKPCSVNEANPNSRGCNYGEAGHYSNPTEAAFAFEAQMGGAIPQAIKNQTPMKLNEAEDAVLSIYEEFIDEDQIEILDHSGLADEEELTLADLRANPEFLANNCYAVSSQLAEELAGGDDSVEVLSLLYRDGHSHHAVSFINPDGAEIVLDYTASQYDDKLPIPFIAERSKWQATIEDRVTAKHGTRIAAIGFESDGPLVQGPAVPERFYHVAKKSDIESIMATGLQPAIGDRSESLGEDAPRVYFFDSLVSAEDGYGSWMETAFDENEELVLLSVDPNAVSVPTATYVFEDDEEESGFGTSTEWTSTRAVPNTAIRVEGDFA